MFTDAIIPPEHGAKNVDQRHDGDGNRVRLDAMLGLGEEKKSDL